MVTFGPEGVAEAPVEEHARDATDDEKGEGSPTVEELLRSLEDDDLTGL